MYTNILRISSNYWNVIYSLNLRILIAASLNIFYSNSYLPGKSTYAWHKTFMQ
jgi:hypothetical protein